MATTMSKKAKGKKVADPNETSKLLAAKISQLEQDAAGEKDQEAEIGVHLISPLFVLHFRIFSSILKTRRKVFFFSFVAVLFHSSDLLQNAR